MMFHWGWSWLTFERSARLITGPVGSLPQIHARHDAPRPVEPAIAFDPAAVH